MVKMEFNFFTYLQLRKKIENLKVFYITKIVKSEPYKLG